MTFSLFIRINFALVLFTPGWVWTFLFTPLHLISFLLIFLLIYKMYVLFQKVLCCFSCVCSTYRKSNETQLRDWVSVMPLMTPIPPKGNTVSTAEAGGQLWPDSSWSVALAPLSLWPFQLSPGKLHRLCCWFLQCSRGSLELVSIPPSTWALTELPDRWIKKKKKKKLITFEYFLLFGDPETASTNVNKSLLAAETVYWHFQWQSW